MTEPNQQAIGPGARLALLVNPVARRAGRTSSVEAAAKVLRRRFQVDLIVPADPAAIAEAARAAAASHDGIVVLGGDGTLNRVVNALGNGAVPIGLLPLGTGNDFARAVGIPAEPVEAAEQVLTGNVRAVDLLDVNGHLFCTAGLLGLPADAALTVEGWTRPSSWARPFARLLGGATYRLAGLQHLVLQAGQTRTLRIRHAGAAEDIPPAASRPFTTYGVFVANTRVLGGGLVLPLDADEADGQMEVGIIPRMPRLRLWWAFVCFAQGWRVPDGALEVIRAAAVEIVADHELPFTADGDLLCRDTRFQIRVRPGALRVIGGRSGS
jgi:diacylglycerol kinase family enzyme